MWLAWLGALLIGLSLGLLGSGGSILTVPILVFLLGQPEKIAIAGSLAIVGGIALIGALPWTLRRQVDWRSVLWFGVPGMIGTWSGAWLSRWMPNGMQILLFAVVMLLAAVMMFRPQTSPIETRLVPRARMAIIADGVLVGVITGLVGVGGGFLIVPALVLLSGLPIHRAIGTSLWIIALKSFSGLVKYVSILSSTRQVLNWSLIALFIVLGSIGALAGNALANRVPQTELKRVFSVFLVIMALFIIWRTMPALLAPTKP